MTIRRLQDIELDPKQPLGLALDGEVGAGLSFGSELATITSDDPASVVAAIEEKFSPRWVWWDRETSAQIALAQIPIKRCWDVLTVHRLLHGGWRTSIALAWAWLHDLDPDTLPAMGQLDLLANHGGEGNDPELPIRPDGHIRPEWINNGWRASLQRLNVWADLAAQAARLQRNLLSQRPNPNRALSAAHSESAADLMCAEMVITGLPLDEAKASAIIAESVGARPSSEAEEQKLRDARDSLVLGHLNPGAQVNLRNPSDVKAMLRRIAVDVPDTRAWRLEQISDTHPLIEALLIWRKAERISTTYGYRWLDEHVRNDRLYGTWSSSDGAAGRMTASAGLHNLPAELRPAVVADPGWALVRADLGQIEPRVLAAVSGDDSLIAASNQDDLYLPIAERLGVEREVAKVAVLGAMYGSTTGESAHALAGLQKAYPQAMALLEDTAATGAAGKSVMTIGGRLIRMWSDESVAGDPDKARQVAAARGRFARNAIIQGAAAEFFKVWAIIVRSHAQTLGAEVVLCLHDEILVHAPAQHSTEMAELVSEAVSQAAYHWSPTAKVRFLADVSVIDRWSEAKD